MQHTGHLFFYLFHFDFHMFSKDNLQYQM